MIPAPPDGNLVLIGMPGAGKSTVGVLLAKVLAREFIDTDLLFQTRNHMALQSFLDTHGHAAFLDMEETVIRECEAREAVIATGGSAVYREGAMRHLQRNGHCLFLHVSLEALERRLTNLKTRGCVIRDGQTFKDLYQERMPLYREYANSTVDTSAMTHEGIVDQILETHSWLRHRPAEGA